MEQLMELTKMLGAAVQQLQQQFVQQQENFQKQQTDVQKQIVKQQEILQRILLKQGEWEKVLNTFSAEGIANSLSEFINKPEEGITFPANFKRYKTIFAKRCQSWSDEEKIMLLLQKLGAHENTIYTNYILPNKPEEMSFEETIETLSKMFGERDSLFHTRYKCLKIFNKGDEDFVAYAGKVNAQCERFKLKDLKEDMFKCLIFVQGLTSNKDKVIWLKILTMLEQDMEITLQKVLEECQKLIHIRWDNVLKKKMLPE